MPLAPTWSAPRGEEAAQARDHVRDVVDHLTVLIAIEDRAELARRLRRLLLDALLLLHQGLLQRRRIHLALRAHAPDHPEDDRRQGDQQRTDLLLRHAGRLAEPLLDGALLRAQDVTEDRSTAAEGRVAQQTTEVAEDASAIVVF